MVINIPTVQADGEGKTEIQDNLVSKETAASNKMISTTPASIAGKLAVPVVSSGMTTALELMNPSTLHSRTNTTNGPLPCGVVPSEAWLQVWLDYSSS